MLVPVFETKSMTDLDSAIKAFRSAERAMGAVRRAAEKRLPADKAAAAQAKRASAERVKDAAAGLGKAALSESQRRDVRRAIDYLRLSAKPTGEPGADERGA